MIRGKVEFLFLLTVFSFSIRLSWEEGDRDFAVDLPS